MGCCDLVFSGFATSCSDDDDGNASFNKEKFDKELSDWEALDLKNYTFSYDYFSSGTGPISCVVVIRDGSVESVVNTVNPESPIPFQSISDMFNSVYNIGTGGVPSDAHSVTLDCMYDSQYHYPKAIDYSVHYKEDMIGGGYYDFEMTHFELLD